MLVATLTTVFANPPEFANAITVGKAELAINPDVTPIGCQSATLNMECVWSQISASAWKAGPDLIAQPLFVLRPVMSPLVISALPLENVFAHTGPVAKDANALLAHRTALARAFANNQTAATALVPRSANACPVTPARTAPS